VDIGLRNISLKPLFRSGQARVWLSEAFSRGTPPPSIALIASVYAALRDGECAEGILDLYSK
jgi:hypothetical protein